jgi:hypothetical protein
MSEPYFEIGSLIELVSEQEPDRPDLVKQLEQCVIRKWIRQPYVQFVPRWSGCVTPTYY